MNLNDFTVYKEAGNVLSMGFKINSIIAKQGLPVMVGGENPFKKGAFDNLNVPLPLAVLHQKAHSAAHESMSGGDNTENNTINMENILDNQQIDDLLYNKLLNLNKLGGSKKKFTKNRKRKSKKTTRKN
jgi:hypothetical protein